MATQVVTATGSGIALSNSVISRYIENYLEAAMVVRLYDQLAMPIGQPMETLSRGADVTVPFLSDMDPGTSTISEVADVDAQTLRDAAATVTPTSRGEALQASEKLWIQGFTDYHAKMAQRVGKNMMETVDALARNAATQGSLVLRNQSTSARSTLNAGSTGHRATRALFTKAASLIQSLKIPGFTDAQSGNAAWAAITNPWVYDDLLVDAGGILEVGQYQKQEIILSNELGSLGNFRLVVSPWAKIFMGAGADHANVVATTLSTAANALATSISVAASSSVHLGEWLTIGTEETAGTHQSKNERVRYVSSGSAGTTINIVGEGANGGLRFDHASATAVRNADSAHTIVFGGPASLVKVFAPSIGEFGQIVGPKRDGKLDQFLSLGWKWYGGYGRIRENGLVRAEVSVSAEA